MTRITLSSAFALLRRWFGGNNIPIDSITVIINIADRDAAMRFDWCLRGEFNALVRYAIKPGDPDRIYTDVDEFTLHGIRLKIESPFHLPKDPLAKAKE